MEIYSALIQDLFRDWLRVQVFTRSPAQFGLCYSAGMEQMKKVLDELAWTSDLDFQHEAGTEKVNDVPASD